MNKKEFILTDAEGIELITENKYIDTNIKVKPDNTNLKPENILQGVSILNVKGTVKQYTPPDLRDIMTQSNNEDQTIIPDGFDGFNKIIIKGDANLIPENIIEGKSILGIVGNAVKPQNKVEIKDTNIVDVKRFAEAQVVDANLISDNIKKGVSILGVTGSVETGTFETWEFTMEDGSVVIKQALIKEGA